MKKITLILMAFIATCGLWQVQAQTEITQANAVLTAGVDFVDGDIYTDSGGSAGNYSNFENSTLELAAVPGGTVTTTFTAFSVEAGWDSLTVVGDQGGFDGTYDGTTLPPAFTSADGGSLVFTFTSDSSVNRPGWTADISVVMPNSSSTTFCATNTPLALDPPNTISTLAAVADTGSPADTGLIGTALGEYSIANVDLNIQSGWASDLTFTLQSPLGTTLVLSNGNGGSNGLTTAANLVFTDASANDVTTWTGGAPLANYAPEGGTFAATFAGESINGDWYVIINDGVNGDGGSLNSYCITFDRSVGTPPEIFCPADFTADNDAGVCGAVVNFAPPIAIDAEDGVLPAANVVQTGGITTGGFFPVGDNVVTFTATDSHLNETSCSFTITVLDAEDPVAVCQDVTVVLDAMGNGSIVASDLDGGSTDNCAVDSMSASQTAFSCSDVGTLTVTLTVFDVAGNFSTCDATVTVVDDIAPIVTCIGAPGSTMYTEAFEGAALPAGWSTDVSVGAWDWTFGSGAMSGGLGDFPTNAAIFDDDAAGPGSVNVASLLSPVYDMTGATGGTLSFDYSLNELGAGETLTAEVWDGAAWQVVLAVNADAAPTNTGAIDVLAYANANFQVRFTYDDAGSWGWSAGVDNFSLTVDTPPAPPLEIALDANGMASVPAGDLIMNVDEACGYTVTSGGVAACSQDNPGNGFENGLFNNGAPFTVANDLIANGDFTLTQITMNLFHDVGATISSVVFTYYEDAAGLPGAVIGTETVVPTSQTVVGSNFGFDVSEVVFDVTPVDFADVSGTGTTYWVGTLASSTSGGITAWEVSTVSSVGNDSVNSGDGGATWGAGGAGDGVYTFSGVCGGTDPANFNFDCSNLGENVVEVFVTDNSGNTSSCLATVVIVDTIAPVLVCGPGDGAVSASEAFEGASLPAGWSTDVTVGSWDWSFGSGAMSGGAGDFPTNAAIFDDDAAGSGNVNVASLLSPVYDMTGATTATVSFDYALDELGAGETLTAEVWDGAAWQVVLAVNTDTTPTNTGAIDVAAYANANFQVRFTYDDAGSWGWSAGVDNFQLDYAVPPVSSDVVIELGADGTTTLDPMDFLSTATDNCGIDVLIADLTEVTCADIGAPILVTIFATDASGNVSSCTQEITVVDAMAPVISCPPNESIELDANGTHTLGDYIASGAATVTDNCTNPVTIFTQDPVAGTVLGFGVNTITFTAEDAYGNVSTCSFELNLTPYLSNNDNELGAAVSMYPNPARNLVTITNSSNILLDNAMIYDINGKLISQINLQDMQAEKVIDISEFATGVYMVQITGEQASVVKRLIKE